MLARPWFERAWVFQEAVLPGELLVHIGDHVLEWKKLARACEIVADLRIYLPTQKVFHRSVNLQKTVEDIEKTRKSFRRMVGGTSHTDEDAENLSLEELLSARRVDKATNVRDKAYSLLGILPPTERDVLKLDYNLTVFQVYSQVIEALVGG